MIRGKSELKNLDHSLWNANPLCKKEMNHVIKHEARSTEKYRKRNFKLRMVLYLPYTVAYKDLRKQFFNKQ